MKRLAAAKPLIIVLSAPSGAGKTTIANAVQRARRKLQFVPGTSTRPKEQRLGGDTTLNFVTPAQFDAIRRRGGFLENGRYAGNQYGTRTADVQRVLRSGRTPLLIIDVKGHAKLRRQRRFNVCSIFIKAESLAELKRRILARRPDLPKAQLAQRIARARVELARTGEYDVVVTNRRGQLKRATAAVLAAVDSCFAQR